MELCFKCNINPKLSYRSYCRECDNERQKSYRKNNPNKTLQWHQTRMNKWAEQCGIYGVKCLATGDFYIGQSIRIPKRIHEHYNKSNPRKPIKMLELMQQYPTSAFIWGVIEYCDKKMLEIREEFWISNLNPSINTYESKLAQPK